ncbi:methyltransferase-like protein 7A [Gigantopelta aegis]|uniref:methyltransferase-like protein 7A n=1 Tax=Gigantopelta aegis TaxID=1735272 RepID=UPI001B887F60|nr:methyltransferase-like protein 7A [Gigantopelta aegis]
MRRSRSGSKKVPRGKPQTVPKYEDNLTDYICGKAEQMSQFADDSFDAVVCTLVLCAVDNPEAVVKEIKRVLRPKVGVFYFAEHVFARIGDGTRVIQKVAEPIWPTLFYGCHLMRESGEVIREAGFKVCKITRFDLHIPSPIMYPLRSAIYGIASK